VRIAAVAVALAVACALPLSAAASTGTGGWQITKSSGSTFSGVFTNTTRDPINGVAVGTAQKALNPIDSFTINGIVCQLYAQYGSAYCYVGLLIQPGASVAFSGASRHALPPAGLQMCSSADKGMDNTCVDVAVKGASVATSARASAAAAAYAQVQVAISQETQALDDLDKGSTLAARNDLAFAQGHLKRALGFPFDAASITGDLKSASQHDADAWDDLDSTKFGKIARSRVLIREALAEKKDAARNLSTIAHG
jgi:hypothetical protein